jgi:hypothetical protein
VKFLVWRHGQRRAAARLIEALHHQHAAAEAHAGAGGTLPAFLFVQLADGDEGKQDRRVRIFHVETELEPVTYATEQTRKSDLIQRCGDCGELALKVGTIIDRRCHGCGHRAWVRRAASAPRELPILFTGPMVRAIIDGQKTQTRRLMKPQPPSVEAVKNNAGIDFGIFEQRSMPGTWAVSGPVWAVRDLMGIEPRWQCPYGVPGDRLWVRETWCPRSNGALIMERIQTPFYAADLKSEKPHGWRWRPSIHMPRWASRIMLEVTGVRVERLQDISSSDISAEGIAYAEHQASCATECFALREAWAALWDGINAKRAPWADNPWVWVVEFQRVTAEEARAA